MASRTVERQRLNKGRSPIWKRCIPLIKIIWILLYSGFYFVYLNHPKINALQARRCRNRIVKGLFPGCACSTHVSFMLNLLIFNCSLFVYPVFTNDSGSIITLTVGGISDKIWIAGWTVEDCSLNLASARFWEHMMAEAVTNIVKFYDNILSKAGMIVLLNAALHNILLHLYGNFFCSYKITGTVFREPG